MMIRMRCFLILASMIVSGFQVHRAFAQNNNQEKAREYYERGIEFLKEAQFQKATIEFNRAYEISPHFSVLYNLGMSYVGSGDSVRAVETLSRYLSDGGNQVSNDRRALVREELERQKARIANLRIEINVDNARVRIDGKEVGKSPIKKALQVSSGDHTIKVTNQGYQTEEKQIAVAGKEQKTLQFTLQPIPIATVENSGQLIVKCAVPDIDVFIDLKKRGTTPLQAPLLVPAGKRKVNFVRNNYSTVTQEVSIGSGTITDIKCDIRPDPDLSYFQTGAIHIDISETEAKIFVDGKPYNRFDYNRLPAGRHNIEIKRSGFESWTRTVSLKGDDTLNVKVNLVPKDDYRRDYESRANTLRILSYVIGGAGIILGSVSLALYLNNDSRFDDWQKEFDAIEVEASQLLSPDLQEEMIERQKANDDKLQSIHDIDAVSIGLAIAGGAMLTTGIVLFLIGDDPYRYEGMVAAIDGNGSQLGWRSIW